LTLGFFSPLPPARTGVADYAAELVPALRELGRIRLNAHGDLPLYHLGNNPLHTSIYAEALARPGIVVLHDAVLTHFLLGALDRAAWIEEFAYNYGEWPRSLAAELWEGRSRSAGDPRYFEYPMLRRVAEAARAVVVHNPAAARAVLAHAPGARVFEIPHLFAPAAPPGADAIAAWRKNRGISESTFLFGVFGYLRETKRLPGILRAFELARRARPDIALLVAGRFVSPGLERALAPLLSAPGVVRVGYAPEPEFRLMASAVDACVNLRWPAAGETSGIAVRLMGAGKPVILTAGDEVARYPFDACLRIEPGLVEERLLAEHMIRLSEYPEAAHDMGRRAAAYIAACHAPRRAARLYWEAVRSCG
jgi:glycosyltransferase involved in cell wall biosynthesis